MSIEPIISYAQNFEDVILWRALGDVPDGCYIDIGAQDPLVDSVSQAFHEHGWHGIHVEPNTEYAIKLKNARQGDVVLEAVVGAARGVATFYALPDTGLSTVDPAIASEYSRDGVHAVKKMSVPAVTLDDVLDLVEREHVHWLKIDVEGAERDVLEGWTSPMRPWVVVVESIQPVTHAPSHGEWEVLLTGKGYRFAYADGLNRFYLHETRMARMEMFVSPPNVFDRFRLSGTATSTFCNALLEQRREVVERNEAETARANRQEAEVERLEEAVSAARMENAELARRQEHLDWLARHQVEQLDEGNAKIEALTGAMAALDREKAEMTTRFEGARAEIEHLRAEHESLRTEHVASLRLLQQQLQATQEASLLAAKNIRVISSERATLAVRAYQLESELVALRIGAQVHEEGIQIARENATRIGGRLDEERGRANALQRQVDELLRSTSWRITSPLRMLSSLLHGNLAEARSTARQVATQAQPDGGLRRVLRRAFPPGTGRGDRFRRLLGFGGAEFPMRQMSHQVHDLRTEVHIGRDETLHTLLVDAGVIASSGESRR